MNQTSAISLEEATMLAERVYCSQDCLRVIDLMFDISALLQAVNTDEGFAAVTVSGNGFKRSPFLYFLALARRYLPAAGVYANSTVVYTASALTRTIDTSIDTDPVTYVSGVLVPAARVAAANGLLSTSYLFIRIGEFALLCTSLFPDNIQHRQTKHPNNMSVADYERIGADAYASAHSLDPDFNSVLKRMGDRHYFSQVRQGMHEGIKLQSKWNI